MVLVRASVPFSGSEIDLTDRFKHRKSSCTEDAVRTIANTIFFISGLFTAMTIYAIAFLAKEIVKNEIPVLIITSLAFAAVGLLLRSLSGFWNDPIYCEKMAKLALEDIEKNNLSFKDIQCKYRILLEKQLITSEDINKCISKDLAKENVTYGHLSTRHGKDFLFLLDDYNKIFVKNLFLDFFFNRYEWSYEELFNSFKIERSNLNIEAEDLRAKMENEILSSTTTFPKFKEKHGLRCISEWSGNESVIQKESDAFKRLREKLLSLLRIQEMSFNELKLVFGVDCAALDISNEQMKGCIIQSQILKLINGKINYAKYRQDNGVDSLTFIQQDQKKHVQNRFLEYIKNEANGISLVNNMLDLFLKVYKEDIEFLDIKNTNELTLKEKIREFIIPIQLGKSTDYNTFRANNGWSNIESYLKFNPKEKKNDFKNLRDQFLDLPYRSMTDVDYQSDRDVLQINDVTIYNAVMKDFKTLQYNFWIYKHQGFLPKLNEKDRGEVIKEFSSFLETCDSSAVLDYASDAKQLGVSIKDFLESRWNKMTMTSILNDLREQQAYLTCIEKGMFDIQTLKNKTLPEISILNLSDVLKNFKLILPYNIINALDLQVHVKGYLKSLSICDYPWSESHWSILNEHSLITEGERGIVSTYYFDTYLKEHGIYKEKLKDREKACESSLRDAFSRKEESHNKVETQWILSTTEQNYKTAKGKVDSLERQINTCESSLKNLKGNVFFEIGSSNVSRQDRNFKSKLEGKIDTLDSKIDVSGDIGRQKFLEQRKGRLEEVVTDIQPKPKLKVKDNTGEIRNLTSNIESLRGLLKTAKEELEERETSLRRVKFSIESEKESINLEYKRCVEDTKEVKKFSLRNLESQWRQTKAMIDKNFHSALN